MVGERLDAVGGEMFSQENGELSAAPLGRGPAHAVQYARGVGSVAERGAISRTPSPAVPPSFIAAPLVGEIGGKFSFTSRR